MTITDKELRRLLAFSKHDDVELLPHVAVEMACELLAARKVVRAAKAMFAADSTWARRGRGRLRDAS